LFMAKDTSHLVTASLRIGHAMLCVQGERKNPHIEGRCSCTRGCRPAAPLGKLND
jgi:hypothetical protein